MLTLIFVDLWIFAFIPFGPSVFFTILLYNLDYTASGLFISFNNRAVVHLASELLGS